MSKPPESRTWKLLITNVNSGRDTAAATITLTTMVATDSWVNRLRQRLMAGTFVCGFRNRVRGSWLPNARACKAFAT